MDKNEKPIHATDERGVGDQAWRSLLELEYPQAFARYVDRVKAAAGNEWNEANRRSFLKLLGASLALAGAQGCGRQPTETIVPYVRQPEEIVPGKPLYFATAMTLAGVATGLLVESHMGRPTKVEGNPRHPSVPGTYWAGDSQLAPGVSDIFAQASILTLYDPERSQTTTRAGEIATWDAFISALRPQLEAQRGEQGAGIRLLTETITSPTLADQIRRFLKLYPQARWIQYEPINDDNALAGAQLAFGRFVDTHYDIAQADVMLALEADFLIDGPNHLRHAFDFANRRDVRADSAAKPEMNRLYVVESTPTLTGAKADHRLPLPPEEIDAVVAALANRLDIKVADDGASRLSAGASAWLDAVVDDLRGERRAERPGTGLLLAGRWLSPQSHALVHAINESLGAVGRSVKYTEPIVAEPGLQSTAFSELIDDMRAGRVKLLCILEGNPAYASSTDANFSAALAKVPFRFRLGLYEDETSALCDWHLPQAHFLESWSDARAADGTVSIAQPLIAPLYQGKTACEIMAAMLGEPGQTAQSIIKQYWRGQAGAADDFEARWQTALHDGFGDGTQAAEITVTPDVSRLQSTPSSSPDAKNDNPSPTATGEQVDLVFRPDPTIWDGRFANNGWLQELPKPFTKLTWDNAALISPQLAEKLGISDGDVVEIEHAGRQLLVPVWRVPGQPERVVTLHLGYGRTRGVSAANGLGFNAYAIQSQASPWHARGARLRATGQRRALACTQHHHLMGGRDLVRSGTLAELQADPSHPGFMPREHQAEQPSLYAPHEYQGHKWGMSIDLGRCIGCNACVLACQAENNIPVVGKEQVLREREMHWIRIDSYYEGSSSQPRVVHQPVPCMHCENAPCEVVCPVGATVHGAEGLNEMVYNRCVGTRYCSNNCPYKVRRFNFLQYSDLTTPVLKLLHSPNVTVRNRGVMEKCTYCVQRINHARIEADLTERPIADGQIVTACQAACPSQAITFGDLNQADSRIAREREAPLSYALLGELGTRPRTTYQALVRNPNPQLARLEGESES